MRRLSFALLLLMACGSEQNSAAPAPPAFVAGDAGTFDKPVDASLPECAESTKKVFVLSEDSSFYSFDPPTLAFTKLGRLECAAGGATPSSMAIDRYGAAWVRHSDASLWKVSTKDLSCAPTSFVTLGETFQFYKFGMGFSSAAKNSSSEDLFLSDNGGAGLAKLNLSTMKIAFVGPYTGELAGKTAELTGTGQGKLFGFFVSAPAQIAEISKTSGEILTSTPLPAVDAGDAWAFSFYAGDFYVYTHAAPNDAGPDEGSNVTRFRPSDGSITVVKGKVGFKIVGAGVSTCAPTDSLR